MTPLEGSGRVTAVLGPTNTGKTHLAMERMLAHADGMIGFPLRLLARENYDRAVRLKGADHVALITGEEKILPPRARWFVCTVESMPTDRLVDFLAIDEIQLCTDPDRGHIFTDRLLNARGRHETLFLGADTMAPLMRKLVAGCHIETRARLSQLSWSGYARTNRLPRRSAIVAFSADDVYALAEMMRRQQGGAAIVLGALSPRTRNAQVDLYQSGEVDYLVATDAIGMGLNMDIDHLAFASLEKFDGFETRALYATEIAQIAGRAGRYRKDGTFGVTANARDVSSEIIESVENHTFPPARSLFWRNSRLDFRSIEHLVGSLNQAPPKKELMRAPMADDQKALESLMTQPEIANMARNVDGLRVLWDVCRIPDFRRLRSRTHTSLQAGLYQYLMTKPGHLPDDYVDRHIRRVDRTEGDIHTLVDHIAGIRVWTYIAHQGGWTKDPAHWQGITRSIEDRLSDALHERLTQRFVDRRTALLMRRLGERAMLEARVMADDGRVLVEDQEIGHLEGLTFRGLETGERETDRTLREAAQNALRTEMALRLTRLVGDEDAFFDVDDTGNILWRNAPVARLEKGAHPLRPLVARPDNPLLDNGQVDVLVQQLGKVVTRLIQTRLAPLVELEQATLEGTVRGLAWQVVENLGTLPRGQGNDPVDLQVRSLSEEERKDLARVRIRLGVGCLFIPDLLKPAPQKLLATLWRIFNATTVGTLPPNGRVSFPAGPGVPPEFYLAIGYRVMGTRAIRVDMIERFGADVRRMLRESSSRPSTAQTETPDFAAVSDTQVQGDQTQEETPGEAVQAPQVSVLARETTLDDVARQTSPPETEEGEGQTTPKPVPEAKPGEIRLPPDMLPPLGIDLEEGGRVLSTLGYRTRMEEGVLFLRPGRRRHGPGSEGGRERPHRPHHKRPPHDARDGGDSPHSQTTEEGRPQNARPGEKPFRSRGNGDHRPRNKEGGRPSNQKSDAFKARGKHTEQPVRERTTPPREKKADPDSPFAILGALLNKQP